MYFPNRGDMVESEEFHTTDLGFIFMNFTWHIKVAVGALGSGVKLMTPEEEIHVTIVWTQDYPMFSLRSSILQS